MNQDQIYSQLLSYLKKEHLKDFEREINRLFQIKENRDSPVLLNLYGVFLEIKKDFNKAIQFFAKCISINKSYAPPYLNLGRLYLHFKMYKSSIDFLKKYLNLEENEFDGEYFLARAYYFNYEYKNAIDLLEKIYTKYENKIDTGQKVEILNLTGAAYTLNKNIDEAVIKYNHALKLDKNNVVTLGNLANAYRSQDKKKEALKIFNKSLELDPNNPHLHKDLSVLIKYKDKEDKHLKEMVKLYNSKNYSLKDKAEIGFAIGKAYDDMKMPEEASKYLIFSNNQRREEFNYNFKNEIQEFELHRDLFGSIKNRIQKNVSRSKPVPIFILGMPRSGTTLVEQILSSHSKVEGGDEIFFLADSLQQAFPHKSFDDFPKCFETDTKNKLNKLSDLYISELDKISNKKNFVTDKMPLNFKLIGLIYHALPNAKIIHCVRDGRDTCLSIYKNNFGTDKLAWAYDQDDLSNFFNQYVDYMKFWKNLYGDFIYDFKYELIINDTENQIKSLLDFCNLEFEHNCLNFFKNKRAVQTVSTMQVRQPIYSSSVKAWEKYKDCFPELFKNIKNY